MLKGNDGNLTACSLTSCRIRAETLARALNSRIWPCAWADRRTVEGDREEEDEEFFETSPSPIEDGEGVVSSRGRNSSAATVEGRAKLYELLQQHADDATDVFYDVSEHAVTSETDCESQRETEHLLPEEVTERDGWEYKPKVQKGGGGDADSCELPSTPSNSPTMKTNSMIGEAMMKTSSFDGDELSGTDLDPDSSRLQIQCEEPNESCEINGTESTTNSSWNEMEFAQNCTVSDKSPSPEPSESCNLNGSILATVSQIECQTFLPNSTIGESCPYSETIEIAINGSVSATDSNQRGIECDATLQNFNETSPYPETTKCSINSFVSTTDSNLKYDTILHNPNESSPSGDPSNCFNGSKSSTEERQFVIEITDDNVRSPKVPSPDSTSPSGSCRLKVFTDLRPMISRSTSLKTGKTPPGTPSRKKIVRFADVLGLDLEDVRHIISGDLPTVPSSAYDDLVLVDNDLPAPAVPKLELKGKQQGAWDSVTTVTAPNALYPKFQNPGQQSDFMDRVRSRGVCLENVVVAEFSVQGTCRVMNWSFDKRVVVRYTTNSWATTSDINASYVSGSSRDGTDCFAFNLFLTPSHDSVEFALRYEVNGKEYWDNNGGGNYCISRHGNEGITHAAVSGSCSPTWMHQFW